MENINYIKKTTLKIYEKPKTINFAHIKFKKIVR